MLIVAFLSVFAWAFDKELGIIWALVLPQLFAMDSTGNYAEIFIFVILSMAVRFVKLGMED